MKKFWLILLGLAPIALKAQTAMPTNPDSLYQLLWHSSSAVDTISIFERKVSDVCDGNGEVIGRKEETLETHTWTLDRYLIIDQDYVRITKTTHVYKE